MASGEASNDKTTEEGETITAATSLFDKFTKILKTDKTKFEVAKLWEENLDEISDPKQLYLERRNRCIVILNNFLNQQGRNKEEDQLPGYEIDEDNIRATFSSLNFEVIVKKDRTVGQIKQTVNFIANSDCSEEDCLVLFILSHGTEDRKILGANNGEIDIQKDILLKLESLKLPVLIFIQACRGRRFPPVVEVTDDVYPDGDTYRPSLPLVQRKVVNSDIFVFYSTMPGDRSFVSHAQGSFFVNRLCAVLRYYNRPEKNRTFHLGDVVTKVNELLSTYVRKTDKNEEIGQVSQVTSSLTKRIFFQPLENYDPL